MTKNDNKIDIKKWKKLYQLAIKIEKLAPWDWMVDTDLFAIMDPKTKKIAYCSVMGNNGEFYGVGIYPGAEGFRSFDLVARGKVTDKGEMMHVQKCLMLSYDKRDHVSKKEMEIIKETGVRFDNRNFWPQFSDYSPGYYPWYISSEDIDFLLTILEQSIIVVLDFKKRKEEFIAYLPERIFLRKSKKIKGKIVWEYEYLIPEKNLKKDKIPVLNETDELECYALKKNLKIMPGLKWELDYFPIAKPVQDNEKLERPYYPYVLLAVEHVSGKVENVGLVEPDKKKVIIFRRIFLETIKKSNVLPEAILIKNQELADSVQVLTDILKIRINLSDDLEMLDIAKNAFSEDF